MRESKNKERRNERVKIREERMKERVRERE